MQQKNEKFRNVQSKITLSAHRHAAAHVARRSKLMTGKSDGDCEVLDSEKPTDSRKSSKETPKAESSSKMPHNKIADF